MIYNWISDLEAIGTDEECILYSIDDEKNTSEVGRYHADEIWDVLMALERGE